MSKRELGIKKRDRKHGKQKPVYLIIAEGKNKTETLYLSNFRQQGKPYSLQFVKAGNKTDADSLYETMSAKWSELELSSENGDMGFIVLDIDGDNKKSDKVMQLIQNNENDSIRFIVSNPTFEIWLLLHFIYTTKHFVNGNAVIYELKKHIPNYDKNRDCYLECLNRIDVALTNTDKLEKHFENELWPSVDCNPRTDMGRLIRILIY